MNTSRLLRAASLMLIMFLVASCATTNQYASKLFAPRTLVNKDTTQLAVKFLELDSLEGNEDQWVKTSIAKKDTTIISNIPSSEDQTEKPGNQDSRLPIVQGVRTKKTRE